jgi:drug/metabolite transporter (DMT)-like permease
LSVNTVDVALQRYAFVALAAATLFGVATPIAKLLLGTMSPVMLAGLLYFGSGLGLAAVQVVRRSVQSEAPLRLHDLPWLVGAVVSGGVLAPLATLWGLAGASASGVSLLLNLEAIMTALIAAAFFGEHVSRRVWVAACLMLAGALLLGYAPDARFGLSLHALAVIGACALWGLDNNLTQKISGADPVTIVMIKGLTAGGFNLGIAAMTAGAPPLGYTVGAALVLGFVSIGVSLVLYILALRHLGSARTAAHYSTAPFIGAVLSLVILREPFTVTFAIALALMAIATWLVLTERHEHEHYHAALEHEHLHVHDAHHRHEHVGDEGPEPHSHPHRHEPLLHSHPHLPDLHHRHPH